MDNHAAFYKEEEAFRHAMANPDDYPCKVVDFDGNTICWVVGPERMEKIFETTARDALRSQSWYNNN